MERKEHIRQLFQKYVNGTYSKADLDELLSYLESESDAAYFKSLLREEFGSDIDITEYKKSIQNIGQEVKAFLTEQVRPKPTRRLYSIIAIGAAAGLFLAVSVAYLFYRGNQAETVYAIAEDIAPGTNRATLSLNNGQSIALSEEKQGVAFAGDSIVYADGTGITSTNDVQFATLTTPRAGQYQLTLPDGTKVWLNAASSIQYPTEFTGNYREVEIKGEVYFEVVHNNNRPFIVKSNGQQIEVLGTAFNVNAYSNEVKTITTLVTGSIRLSSGESIQSVTPGQQAVLQNNLYTVKPVDVASYTAWKEGVIVLNKADFETIAKQIERWYDVEFMNLNDIKLDTDLSGEIPRNINLSSLLKALEKQTNMKFSTDGRRIRMRQ